MALTYTTDLGLANKVRNDLAFRLRRRVFDLFMKECAPTPRSRVADFGVSGHRDHPVHHFFEHLYPHRENLTALGWDKEGTGWLPGAFPGIRFLECDLRSISLPDGTFDYGICNAVVEHAGDRLSQKALVHEVCRVCRQVLFTTPNRRFLIELHTFLPVFHWLRGPVHRSLLRSFGCEYFAKVENLNPVDAKAFLSLFPAERCNRLLPIGFPLLPANLVCISSAR